MTITVLTQFRVESQANGLVHLIFDCPGRTMNVFSNAAIHELATFAAWLAEANVKGVLIRSGKDNAFCAGADLTELGVAYDMIMEAKPRNRFNVAFDHFFPLSKAIRALETAGKPVAAAIAGLALGGGCELALGAHYRVLVDDPKIGMGLPESLVGLLPGAGGTQRLPRLVGVDVALPILLDGGRLSGQAALDAGLVHELATAGEEIARAEAWLLTVSDAAQPWDSAGWQSPAVTPMLTERRASADPHNPAITSILDCVEFGLPQSFEGAIRSEMAIFAALIQRPEPRNMIQTLFLGKTDYDRAARKETLPSAIAEIVAAVQDVPGDKTEEVTWRAISAAVAPLGASLSFEERRIADYACVAQAGFPAFLGGPFTFAERGFD
jgi:3-hydroxyacyl-CoA dehydrogenase / enoyl-CoA hydratase / 3-hydroxybutyryl-CoA epimerase